MASIVVNGDTSGAVTLSAPAVAGTVTVTLPATSGTMLTTASSTGVSGSAISSGTVAEAYGGTGTNTGYYGFKNRLINGAMVIDQRNAGASVTPTSGAYTLDRWKCYQTTASKFSVQQNAGSVTPPVGFTNYLGATSLSAYSVSASDYYTVQQAIEAYNTADLGWGTANAKTVTLSFWVRSSLTGTFGGSIFNAAGDRSYPFTYTISSANTWEYETITIAGDTSGSWGTTNGISLQICFSLGAGSTYSGTAGAWAGTLYTSVTGAVSVVGTNGATFYVTGVQLEKGSTATSFDYRPYGTELQLCMRYYEKSYEIGTVPGTATYLGSVVVGGGSTGSTTSFIGGNSQRFTVPKRTAPTVTVYDPAGNSGVCQRWQLGVSNVNNQNWVTGTPSATCFDGYSGSGSNTSGVTYHYTASAEL
jgi:hypothetical protein